MSFRTFAGDVHVNSGIEQVTLLISLHASAKANLIQQGIHNRPKVERQTRNKITQKYLIYIPIYF